MSNQSRISSFLASATFLLLSSSGASAAETCSKKDEQPLEFRFFTDSNSWKDNGWILECEYGKKNEEKELVWEVPIGAIKKQSQTEVIREAACVPDDATCYLNIFDASGDGLQGTKKGNSKDFSGWFAFLHGATTVATYKGQEEFGELSYCVGPKCHKKPQEVKSNDKDCQDMVYLAMQLDNEPQETSYQLICGGEEDGLFDKRVVWDGSGFTEPGAYVEEETCLPKDACCEFIVVDGSSNGLTDAIDGSSKDKDNSPMGFIYLEKNYEPVLEYNGNTGETFGVLTKRFACGADEVGTKDNKKEIVATEAVSIPEEEEVESEQEAEEEESDVEVLNNLEGAFDPEKQKEIVAAVEEVYEERPEDFLDPDKQDEIVLAVEEVYDQDEKAFDEYEETSEDSAGGNAVAAVEEAYDQEDKAFNAYEEPSEDTAGEKAVAAVEEAYDQEDKAFESYEEPKPSSSEKEGLVNQILELGADFTWPPTTAKWVEDDDFGKQGGFGFGNAGFGGYYGLTDDVFPSTQNPTVWSSSSTSSPTSDISKEGVDDMIKDLNDKTPLLPSDPNALAFLNGKDPYGKRKVGLTRNAKIAIGILVPLFLLWSIGLAVYYYRGKLGERLGATDENSLSLEKGDNTLKDAQSDNSLNEDSINDNV